MTEAGQQPPHWPESITDNIDAGWRARLTAQFEHSYFASLGRFLAGEIDNGRLVLPPFGQMLRAFALTPFETVKVVILGQDPYHGAGQATGLSFSVPHDVRIPPSLRNIFKEYENDLGLPQPQHGSLDGWARQGVLLLNTVLSVGEGQAGAHQGKGWERLTDAAIASLNDERQNLVFILWGRAAQEKGRPIDRSRHLVIESAHPSPLSAHRGFFGTRPFSRANSYLMQNGQAEIDWQL